MVQVFMVIQEVNNELAIFIFKKAKKIDLLFFHE